MMNSSFMMSNQRRRRRPNGIRQHDAHIRPARPETCAALFLGLPKSPGLSSRPFDLLICVGRAEESGMPGLELGLECRVQDVGADLKHELVTLF